MLSIEIICSKVQNPFREGTKILISIKEIKPMKENFV